MNIFIDAKLARILQQLVRLTNFLVMHIVFEYIESRIQSNAGQIAKHIADHTLAIVDTNGMIFYRNDFNAKIYYFFIGKEKFDLWVARRGEAAGFVAGKR